MQLHFITGGKGGIGKTLSALSLILYYMGQNIETLIIDLNYHNLDISNALKGNMGTVVPLQMTGFQIELCISSGTK